jgi:para-nitrobenzyl esterase
VFPGLSWSKGPYGTRTYAVIMQDDDALPRGMPVLHWTMYDIALGVRTLDAGMTAPPAEARNGPNMFGASHAYSGPHTPPGPRHHYHFQVFALDQKLDLRVGSNREDLVRAMRGHVLAKGELVGLFKRPDRPAKP